MINDTPAEPSDPVLRRQFAAEGGFKRPTTREFDRMLRDIPADVEPGSRHRLN